MVDSETFRSVGDGADYASGYCLPEVFAQTSSMVLYRVRKAGKYFIIKTLSKKNQPLFLFLKEKRVILCGEKSATLLEVISPA